MADLRLFLFGSPHFEYRSQTINVERRKALGLAAYLAITEQPQNRDTLAALFWPDQDQISARSALRGTLPALTTLSADRWIDANRMTVTLDRQSVWVDVHQFLDWITEVRSHHAGADGLCSNCVKLLEQAADLYQDDFLAGFTLPDSVDFDDWQSLERERLRREQGGTLRKLAQHYAAQAAYQTAISFTRRWLALDSLHEPAHRMLMRLYVANGERTDALRYYQDCVELLDAELATPPEEETTALYRAIRENSPALPPLSTADYSPPAGVLPPLPGLVIGRDDVLTELKQRLGMGGEFSPVTVIRGWPGVGKSTIVAMLAHDPQVIQTFGDGILWASLGEHPGLLAELSIWAEALHLRGAVRTVGDLSIQLISALRDKRLLLILDDVWKVEDAAPFRVGGQQCAIIMTTRFNDVAQALAPAPRDMYRLPLLNEDQALKLLHTLAPEATADYAEEARDLMRDLEGLPLAIQVAGRLLHNEAELGWGVRELLAELRDGAGLLSAKAPGDMMGANQDTPLTVTALLKRSTDALDAEARQRFALLGFFVPKPATFDLSAMAVAWDAPDPKPTVRKLVNRGLLEPISGGRFQLHSLLVLHARSLLEA